MHTFITQADVLTENFLKQACEIREINCPRRAAAGANQN